MADPMIADKPEKKTVSVSDVLAKDKAPKSESKTSGKGASAGGKKKKMKHTHIEHHHDEQGNETGHTVRHTPEGGGPEVSYATPDMDGVHDGLEQHVGGENAGEGAQSAQAQPGAQPQAQPEPMAQPQPQQVGA